MAEVLTDIDTLAKSVLEVDENVKDYMAVAVILESLGVTDRTAEKYGYENVFKLAEAVFEVIEYYRLKGEVVGVRSKTELEKALEAMRLFMYGMLLSSPWLLTLIAYTLFRVSLLPMPTEPLPITAVGLSSMLSLIVTSWLPHPFMRKMLYYNFQGSTAAVRQILKTYLILGVLLVASSSLVLMYVSKVWRYPGWWTAQFMALYVPLSLLWLSVAPLYALTLYEGVFLTYVVSLTAVWLGYKYMVTPSPYYPQHITGLAAGVVVSLVYVGVYLYVRSKFKDGRGAPRIRYSLTLYIGAPYATASALYFVFMFLDRFFAWWTGGSPPFIAGFWYENPAVVSLLAICIPFGFLNYWLHRMYIFMPEGGKLFTVREAEAYRRRLRRLWTVGHAYILVSGFASLAVILWFVEAFWSWPLNHLTVLTLCGIGNVLLASSLMDMLLCFYLYRPWTPTAALVGAICFHAALTWTTTGFMGPMYAALGYMVSSALLTIVLSALVSEYVEEIDYYFYSAY